MKAKVVKLLLSVLRFIANILQQNLSFIYKKIFSFEWSYFSPEFFDHKIDIFYQWPKLQDPYPLKRGVLSNFWIEKFTDAKVMELCCGDGFNTYSFYCPKNVKSVIACDYLQSSIDFAKKKLYK